MRFIRLYAVVTAAALLAFAGSSLPAFAVTNAGAQMPTGYVAAFAPVFGTSGVPHSGTMQLVVSGGSISGTYTGTSSAPDPLDDRIVPVTGTLSDDGYLQLQIGGALSLQGTMDNRGAISGTATYLGRLYEFMAKPGTPASAAKTR